jgi:hypothetical protein
MDNQTKVLNFVKKILENQSTTSLMSLFYAAAKMQKKSIVFHSTGYISCICEPFQLVKMVGSKLQKLFFFSF